MTKWLKQLFCRHDWVKLPSEEADRQLKEAMKKHPNSYFYCTREHACLKCGKFTMLGSDWMF